MVTAAGFVFRGLSMSVERSCSGCELRPERNHFSRVISSFLLFSGGVFHPEILSDRRYK